MKNFKLTLLILGSLFMIQSTFAQKGKITDAQLSLQEGKVMDAKKSIDAAFQDTNALKMVKAWSTKGEVYKTIYEGKVFYPQNPNCLFVAKEAYMAAYTLETNPKKQKDFATPLTDVYGYLFNEGFERFNNKKFEDAYKHFDASRNINEFLFSKGLASSLDTNAIFATAIAGSNLGKTNEMVPLFEKLIDMKYENPSIYETLAQIYEKIGDKAALAKVVQKGLAKYPKNNNLQVFELNSALDGGDVQQSIEKFEKAAANDSKNASIFFNLGVLYDKATNIAKAKENYEKAIALKPDYSDAYFNVGVMYFNEGVVINKKMNEVDDKVDKDGKIYNGLKKQRDDIFTTALPYLEKAYAIDPKNADYKQNLKKVYASMNMLDKAKSIE